MNRYEIDEVNRAINDQRYSSCYYGNRPNAYRSENRQWDRIIGVACTGCGKIMNRYDTRQGHAFCYNCRSLLFPEGNNPKPSRFKRKRYNDFWWHGL